MTIPKYLRPIRDVEAHGLTSTEKAVRWIVFVPFLILFSLPRGLLLGAIFAGLGFAIWFLPAGLGRIIDDPATHSFELTALLSVVALLLFSNSIAKAIRRYFLPFG